MKKKGFENQILLGQSRFGVDYESKRLIPLDVSGKEISFDEFGRNSKGDYTLEKFYESKRSYRYLNAEDLHIDRLIIPKRAFDRPFVDDEFFIKESNKGRKRKGFLLLDQATVDRIENNVLPRIQINGKHWNADGYEGVLHDPVNKGVAMRFPFDDDYTWNESDRYLLLPYKGRHGFIDGFVWDEHLAPPDNIMLIKMLRVDYLDPIGRAVAKKKSPGALLYDRPYRDYHKAVPISWNKCYFATIVNDNRETENLPPLQPSDFRRKILKEDDLPDPSLKRKKGIRM